MKASIKPLIRLREIMKLRLFGKVLVYLSIFGGGILLVGCVVANPKFHECSTNCIRSQTDCMTNATSPDDIRMCKDKQTECVKACEMKFPRLLKRTEFTEEM